MINKNEINLKSVSESGETYIFSASDLLSLDSFKALLLDDEKNSISLKLSLIGDEHYQVKASINIKSLMSCVKCGEDVKDWFKDEITEYLSLDVEEEGEEQGFLLVDSPRWKWPSFIIDSIELEKPYRNYKCAGACLKSLSEYNKDNEAGWDDGETPKPSAFSALEGLKSKLK